MAYFYRHYLHFQQVHKDEQETSYFTLVMKKKVGVRKMPMAGR